MGRFNTSLLLALLFRSIVAPDYYFLGRDRRQKPFYIVTFPETVHPGETFNVGITMSKRFTDVIVHLKLVTWHGESHLAAADRLVPMRESDQPFLIRLKLSKDVEEGLAMIVIRLLQYPYKEEKRIIRIEKEKAKIFSETNKGYYQPGENVKLWVLALDRYAMPFEGKVQSLALVDEFGGVIDYKRELALDDGFANVSFSTQNAMQQGKHMVIFKIDKQETKIIVHIGNTHDGSQEKPRSKYQNVGNQVSEGSAKKTSTIKSKLASDIKIDLLMPKTKFEPGSKAELIIIYNKPRDGLNEFLFEVVCSGETFIRGKEYDLYSSMYCGEGVFRLNDKFSTGPTRDELCEKGQTRFSIFFKITDKMYPQCSILMYQLRESGKVFASVKSFKVLKKQNDLKLLLNKRKADPNEELTLEISTVDVGTLVLSGRVTSEPENPASDININCENLRTFQVGELVTRDAESLFACCKRHSHATAGCFFSACGVKVVSSLDVHQRMFCSRARYSRGKLDERKDPVQTTERREQPWLWLNKKVIDLNGKFYTKLIAPSNAGTYSLDAIFVSKRNGVSLGSKLSLTVKEKPASLKGRRNESAPTHGGTVKGGRDKHSVFVEIQPNLDEYIFPYGFCQPLNIQICSSASRTKDSILILNVNMVRNFKLVKRDLNRVYREHKLIFYVIMANKAMLYIKQPTFGTECFKVKLKQFGALEFSLNNGTITYTTIDTKEERRLRFWITEKDCGAHRINAIYTNNSV